MDIKDLSKIDIKQLMRNKTIMINIGIIIVAFFVARTLIIKQSSRVNNLKQRYAEDEKIGKAISELVTLDGKIINIQKEFYSDIDANTVLNAVTKVLKENNINFSSLTPEPMVDQGLYVQFPVRVNLQTDFHALGRLIRDLENLKQVMYVETLKANYAGHDPANEEIELLNVELKIWGASLKK